MTLNARFNLKCAQWTARLTYVCCGFRIRPYAQVYIARGRGGKVGWRTQPPPCEQLTRCFSAVAELLVDIWPKTTFISWSQAYIRQLIFTPRTLHARNVEKREYDVSVSMNIDDRPTTDLALWKISSIHKSATGHPIHLAWFQVGIRDWSIERQDFRMSAARWPF